MKLRQNKQIDAALKRASSPFRRVWPKLPEALIGICCLIMVAFCLLTYSTETAHYTSRLFSSNKYLALLDGLFNPFRTRHILLKSALPVYDIKISHQEFAKIDKVVEEAKKQGWMSDDQKVWGNGQFIHDGQVYNVKLRVRGDLPAHWKGPKKSWRIKFGRSPVSHNGADIVEEKITFRGRTNLNLIIPIDRDYVLANFINGLMRKRGLVVPEDRFVVLRINGAIQGLYYEVEHFDNPLLAMNNRPETTVFGQNDRAMHFEQYTKYGTPAASDIRYDIGSLRRLVDTEGELAMQAMDVLQQHSLHPTPQNFRRVRAVMDWDRYLTFRVMTTLCNTNHVRFGSDNLRLYFDPSRGLLEPIPWDLHITKMPKEPGTIDFWNNKGPDEIQRSTLLDPQLRLERNKVLWSFVGDGGDSLIAQYAKIHNKIRPFAWADVLYTPIQAHKMDVLKNIFDYNVRRIHKVMSNSSGNFTYRLEANDRAAMEIFVNNFSGIQLQKIELTDSLVFAGNYQLYEDSNFNGELDPFDALLSETEAQNRKLTFDFDQQILPEIEYKGDWIDARYWEFFDTKGKRARFFLVGKLAPEYRDPLLWTPPHVTVTSANAVTGYQIPSAFISQNEPLPDNYMGITAYDHSDPFDLDAIEYTQAEFLKRNPQFVASTEQPGAVELRGKVTIDGAVIVPKHVPLILRPGTDITMMPGANVLNYGGLTSIGTAENPIRIHGDGSGRPFDAFAVVRPTHRQVVMRHTEVRDGGQSQINGILFTGGFAVHEGDLDIEHCQFINMQSEDGLNLKYGHIVMRNCLFMDSASDGIDLDFCTGIVQNNKFMNTVGDGLDLSGARDLVITENWLENIGDKGVSVGENSHPIIINNLFQNCVIGISTKDLSHARVAHCTFVGNQLAIEAKRKKEMFGGASAEVVNSVFYENKSLLEEDYFSKTKVSVQYSLLDAQVNWPTCKTTDIRFIDPQNQNFLVEPLSIMGNGFNLSQPEWLKSNMKNGSIHQPGIFSQTLLIGMQN
jgi:spore coat protein CotH